MTSIFLVDDDEPTSRLIKLTLSLEGCTVSTFRTPDEALAAAKRGLPDLVISDYLMPGLDVGSFVELLRGEGFRGAIVVCTAFDGAIDLPGTTIFRKPFDPDQLASTVISLLPVRD
jgi:CheY-like chemotaxis protein